jgi:hypothetical protein
VRVVAVVVLAWGCGRFSFDAVTATADGRAGDGPTFPSGLVAYYPMEQTLADPVGHHDATCAASCPTYVTGMRGMAAAFAGQDLASASSAPDLLDPEFTVALWLQVTQTPTTFVCPIGKLVGTVTEDSWQICLNQQLTVHFIVSNGTSSLTLLSPASPFPINTWHHVAVRSGAATGRTIWIDGAQVAGVGATTVGYDGGALLLGGDIDNGTPLDWLPGYLDEVQIYNRALDDTEMPGLATP